MVSTYTTNKAIEKPSNNSYVDTWNVPVNNDWDIIDSAFGGIYTVTLASTDVVLTQANVQNVCILLTGTLGANVKVSFPALVAGFYIVRNTTSGSYTVTLNSAYSGTSASVTATQGANTFIWSDGQNVYKADASTLVGGTGITVAGNNINLNTPVTVANGGTGNATYTDGQLLIGNSSTGGLTKANLTAGTNISITNGNGTITIAAAGAATTFDPANSYTFTGLETFNGTINNLAALLSNSAEVATINSTYISSSINYDVTTQSVLYYGLNATNNWGINIRGNSTKTLDSLLGLGQSITIALLTNCGTTAYYNNAVTIDGNSVTPVWQGSKGAPTAGFASSLNAYVYTIIKTQVIPDYGPTYVVLASLTQFS
jgi:hypothetical protein